MHKDFYQNRLAFVEDMTKTFRCVLSVHSVELMHLLRSCADISLAVRCCFSPFLAIFYCACTVLIILLLLV